MNASIALGSWLGRALRGGGGVDLDSVFEGSEDVRAYHR